MLACTKCKIEKPETSEFFPLHNKKRNGLDSWCKKCRSTYRNGIRRGHYRDMIDDKSLSFLIETTKECTICASKSNLVVDHDHKTNKIRGMLCNRCNQGLGQFKDDPELLEYARIYLLASQEDNEADLYIKTYGTRYICEEALDG